ncbi:hypothetical protein HQ945_17605 [Phyllobacterium sp. BT25]|uniref:PepSY domain-containing protein n=1 Tax=Phyllobacterium pellucidum TaxID=2740464 RepID=A0A849VWT9_9HYPH|nr:MULTISPECIES: hypothetical protein [Phyllobacterium]NTS33079.1 hypothetical protein [Phyllobacterium pellucidum]UGY11390.1 hypothetical protein LLE51_017940 [Phyllobacterium sp. T1018]SFJ26847.1 hypothetical protein SAMN04515648_3329 [Phyllobacterium sp. CL33Tsu]
MRQSFVSLAVACGILLSPVALPSEASATTVSVTIGTSVSNGRGISCSEGERRLRSRGFRDVRRIDCRGRFFVYRAWRGSNRFEVALRQRDGRIVDMRRISSRR